MRTIWKGTIEIGAVKIPVTLHTAVKENRPKFHQISPCCNSRISQQLICQKCGRQVNRSELKKGWEVRKNEYVIIEPHEIEALKLKTLKTIEIDGFIQTTTIDPMLIRTNYYVGQIKGSEKTFSLLYHLLEGRCAVGKIVLHGYEPICVLRRSGKNIFLSLLWYPDEIKPSPEVTVEPPSENLKKLGEELAESMTKDIDFGKYKDRYVEAVRELITAKLTGQKIEVPRVEEKIMTENLEEALRKSIRMVKEQKVPAVIRR